MDIVRYLTIVINPDNVWIARRIDTLKPDGGDVLRFRYLGDCLVKLRGEGVGCIHHQTDIAVTTECLHCLCIKRPIQT